jgi:hypothetical protein
MGGKGGGETTSTVHQSNLPEYAAPYYKKMMEDAFSESQRPYQPYEAQRLADQSEQTTAGLNMGQQFAQSGMGDLDNARSLANAVGGQAMDLQNYEAGGVNNTYGGPADWQNGQFNADQVTAERLGSENFGAEQRDQYMSPYMDAVVNASQRDAQQKALEEQAMLRAQQGAAGGFGGSRGAVQNQMALNQAQQRISDIGVQGRQAAFENAQSQFERDQQRAMSAASGNQQASLQAALANQGKNLEALGMGEQSRQFGYEAGEQGRQKASELGMQAQTATEQLRQGGEQLGLSGLELAGNTAGQMAGFGQLSDQMSMDRIKTMLGVGQATEDRQQQGLDMAYQDFMNQVNFPRQNLQFLSSLMHGVPISADQNTTTTTPSNPISGGIGTLLGMSALQKLGTTAA